MTSANELFSPANQEQIRRKNSNLRSNSRSQKTKSPIKTAAKASEFEEDEFLDENELWTEMLVLYYVYLLV